MAGVDLRTVQELMGHKSIQMTVRYSHLTPKHTLAAVERLAGRSETPTDTKTSTETEEQISQESGRMPTNSFQCRMLQRCGPVAQPVRAADS